MWTIVGYRPSYFGISSTWLPISVICLKTVLFLIIKSFHICIRISICHIGLVLLGISSISNFVLSCTATLHTMYKSTWTSQCPTMIYTFLQKATHGKFNIDCSNVTIHLCRVVVFYLSSKLHLFSKQHSRYYFKYKRHQFQWFQLCFSSFAIIWPQQCM